MSQTTADDHCVLPKARANAWQEYVVYHSYSETKPGVLLPSTSGTIAVGSRTGARRL